MAWSIIGPSSLLTELATDRCAGVPGALRYAHHLVWQCISDRPHWPHFCKLNQHKCIFWSEQTSNW
jgi:hypothetical protein